MKQFPIQQLKILYNKYGTRNNKVKSLMRATRNRVHMLSPSMPLPLYYNIPVGAKRLQRAWQKRPSAVSSSPRSFSSSPRRRGPMRRGRTGFPPAPRAPLALKRNARGGRTERKDQQSRRPREVSRRPREGGDPCVVAGLGFPSCAALPVNSQDLVLEELPRQ